MEPWTQKYTPKSVEDIVGNKDVFGKLKRLILTADSSSKAIFLEGEPGTGKTSSVYAIAEANNLEVVEINASDTRKKKAVQSLLSSVIGQQSLFAQGKIVLIDEIEGLSGRTDRGGKSAIRKIMKQSTYPVVITGRDAYDRSYKKIRKKSVVLSLDPVSTTEIFTRLRDILDAEGIEWERRALKQLARTAGGDLRAAINDMQASIIGNMFVYSEMIASSRDVDVEMEQALTRIFKTTDIDVAKTAYSNVQQTLDKIFLWMDKNLSKEYTKPEDLKTAYDTFSYADILFGRIRRRQYYRFYSYCYDLLSVGIALAKEEPYRKNVSFEEPDRPLKIWIYNRKTGKEKDVAEALASYVHVSQHDSRLYVLPYIKKIAEKDNNFGTWLAEQLELESKQKNWLLK